MNRNHSPYGQEIVDPNDEEVEAVIASGDLEQMKRVLVNVNKANHRLGMDPSGLHEIPYLHRTERLYLAIKQIEPDYEISSADL